MEKNRSKTSLIREFGSRWIPELIMEGRKRKEGSSISSLNMIIHLTQLCN